MKFFMVCPYYLSWHYSRGLLEWIRNLFTFLYFEYHFFSVPDLLKTLFAPFQRLTEKNTSNALDIEAILSVFLVNIIMRAVGFFVRSCILIVAACTLILSLICILILILLWLVLPLLLCIAMIGAFISYLKYQP